MSTKQKAIEAHQKRIRDEESRDEITFKQILSEKFPNAVYKGNLRAWYDDNYFIQFDPGDDDYEDLIYFNCTIGSPSGYVVLSEADVGRCILAVEEKAKKQKGKIEYSPTKKQNCFHFLLDMFR